MLALDTSSVTTMKQMFFVRSALHAKNMELGRAYILDSDKSRNATDTHKKVIIMDNDTEERSWREAPTEADAA